MKFLKYLNALAFIFVFAFSFSQNQTQQDNISLSNATIANQFEFLLKKSGDFRGTNGQMYEAVKRNMILTLRANTLDSLKTIHKNLANTKAVVKNQAKEISDLKLNLSNTQSDLELTNSEKDSMDLFGIQMSKTGYNALLWSIIIGLLALFLLFVYKFKNSNTITKNARIALSEMEEDFDEHRKTALEREQKVRRQLQDEINKQKKTK